MIKVTHEIVEIKTGEFGLIELDLLYRGHQVCLMVPSDMDADTAENVRRRANHKIATPLHYDYDF